MGAVWISTPCISSSCLSCSRTPTSMVEHGGGNVWEVKARSWGTAARSDVGHRRGCPPRRSPRPCCSSKPVMVRDRVHRRPDRYVVNADETTAAQEKAAGHARALRRVGAGRTPSAPQALLREYNSGSTPGAARLRHDGADADAARAWPSRFVPTAHQRAAVARIIAEPSVGLFHQVGAGKTAEMVDRRAMELRRLGLVAQARGRGPQPHARAVRAASGCSSTRRPRSWPRSSDDLARDSRRTFVARVATNDWDAVIMTRTAFERIPSRAPRSRTSTWTASSPQIRGQLERPKSRGARLTVKKLEKMIARAEDRLQKLPGRRVDAVSPSRQPASTTCSSTRPTATRTSPPSPTSTDAAIAGSKRATDLHMKLEYLRVAPRRARRHVRHRHPDRQQHHRGAT